VTGRTAGASGDLVEEYLDRLLVSLAGSPRQVRHTLAEVEAHLRDAVGEGIAAGLPEQQAQEQALERIGPVHLVAGRPAVLTRPSAPLLRRLALTAALVGGAGFVAIGVAGIVGRFLNAAQGSLFMTPPFPPGTYTQADCARWLAGDPGTHSCVTAMLADHIDDFFLQTGASAVLGLIGLAAYVFLRRRWSDRATATALPAGTAAILGGVLAGLAAIVSFGQVIDAENVKHGVGAGEPLSFAIAATAAALVFALGLRHITRSRTS
jgi:MYXO-CTERM domain-containing protein